MYTWRRTNADGERRSAATYARPFTKSDWLELALLALAQAGLSEHELDRIRDMVTF